MGVVQGEDRLTPYGGIAAWSAFVKKLGIVEELAGRFPIQRTSPNATPVGESFQPSW
jgi:hypothetical protein